MSTEREDEEEDDAEKGRETKALTFKQRAVLVSNLTK